ncbi:hypothetical protein [Streptomyces gardneri]|uniref:Uncharacterized protein n=1 Tax=Streptomyces gardneri TaxID=66892 RepID=A0A4Y3RGU7_9ACTN|nr:hypothetical protein [Streptomyces gardneri]GEB57031.1 hypothetical protein SGA01_26360 [Streptomyces gardneri]GHH16846.1 hypothetical protein GCM10017674_67250 [Streptomyces gardneri]
MAHLVFDQAEQRELREAARAEFPGNAALAYVLENLASEGIDLNRCRDWDDIRAEKGMPERNGKASEVA